MVLRNTLVSENFEVFAYNKPCSFEKHDTAKAVAFWSYRNSTLDIFLQNSGFAHLWSLKNYNIETGPKYYQSNHINYSGN
jgi:hypothetical protein